MKMSHNLFAEFFIFYIGFLTIQVLSTTDSQDVSALNVMYTSLNSPSRLSGWKARGGDPCGESWKGIKCSGSSVTEINLPGLGLNGQLGYQLSNLKSVSYLDVSNNNLRDSIPYQLPPNLQHLDFSKNQLTGSIPYSISQMTRLKYLNLGRNQLSGQITDMFQKMTKLEYLDLSFNRLTGTLPHSFASLSGLKKLYLQNNQLTGSVNILDQLPSLEEVNIENNKFTGWLPGNLKEIGKTGGNSWSTGPAPPPPPGTKPAVKRNASQSSSESKTSAVNGVVIVASVLGGLAFIIILIALFSRKKKSSQSALYLDEERGSHTPLASQELTSYRHLPPEPKYPSEKSFNSDASVDIQPFQRTPSVGLKYPLSNAAKSFNDNEFANRLKANRSTSARAISFTLSELQTATANFAPGRLLGEGTIGRVYRAKYPDGRVLAVKKIDSSHFQGENSEKFSEIVANMSRIHHTNIAELVGFCSEQGHNMLIYEYFRNGSLHEFLHMSDDFSNPLTWNTRVRIALGAARAVEYLHEVCSPSVVHKNIKSSNVLLDLELNPHLSDYALASFHQRTSQNLGAGYNAPECVNPSAYTLKSDVYSFGVVMLELLTGRMPYNSNKPKSEQCLVRWAAPQLHDTDALARMVDPALRGLYPAKSVSRFADVIALCVQPEPEFRPPMSEVVEKLVRLIQRSSMNLRDDLSASRRTEDSDY